MVVPVVDEDDLPTCCVEVESLEGGKVRVRLTAAPDQQGPSAALYPTSPLTGKFRSDAELGRALYNCLFGERCSSEIGRRFMSCYERLRLRAPGKQVFLRLALDFSPASGRKELLAGLPWELLHDDQQWLIRDGGVSLTRMTSLARPRRRLIEGAYRFLIAYAEPKALTPFDGDGFVRLLKQELETVPLLTVEILPHATAPALRESILHGDFDIVHVIGHGEAVPDSITGISTYLHLESAAYPGLSEPVPAQTFSQWLAEARLAPQLLVLMACQSAVADAYSVLGLAQAALHSGVPAVIGVQASVSVPEARRFSQALYMNFASITTIDQAMHTGRLTLDSLCNYGTEAVMAQLLAAEGVEFPSWAMPILLLNGSGWLGKAPPQPRISWRLPNGATVAMVYIPEGEFYIDIYPVTCGEYRSFSDSTNRTWTPQVWQGSEQERLQELPATNVGFTDAMEYALWSGRSLPSVAEWQTAALSGVADKQARYPWGDDANVKVNTRDAGLFQPLPVREEAERYPHNASPAGMCGIMGNIAEFARDESGCKLCGGSFRDMLGALSIQLPSLAPSRPTSQIGFRCVASLAAVDSARRHGNLDSR